MVGVYSPQVLDHFEHPRNPGTLSAADAVAQLENPVCGDILQLAARVSAGRIVEIRFLAKGCVPVMACGSALAEFLQGKTLAEAAGLRRQALVEKLGGLPAASSHASQLAMDALAALLNTLAK
jgi:nitrogen fixation protein NifU and related proteins